MRFTPLKPSSKPMRAFRKDRRPGNRPMTRDEAALVDASKDMMKCVPCFVWAALGNMPLSHVAEVCAWDHKKSGNIRRGHAFGFACCDWHHQRIKPDDWTFEAITKHFGPSLMDGSALFRDTYGTNDELIELQHQLLAAAKH